MRGRTLASALGQGLDGPARTILTSALEARQPPLEASVYAPCCLSEPCPDHADSDSAPCAGTTSIPDFRTASHSELSARTDFAFRSASGNSSVHGRCASYTRSKSTPDRVFPIPETHRVASIYNEEQPFADTADVFVDSSLIRNVCCKIASTICWSRPSLMSSNSFEVLSNVRQR